MCRSFHVNIGSNLFVSILFRYFLTVSHVNTESFRCSVNASAYACVKHIEISFSSMIHLQQFAILIPYFAVRHCLLRRLINKFLLLFHVSAVHGFLVCFVPLRYGIVKLAYGALLRHFSGSEIVLYVVYDPVRVHSSVVFNAVNGIASFVGKVNIEIFFPGKPSGHGADLGVLFRRRFFDNVNTGRFSHNANISICHEFNHGLSALQLAAGVYCPYCPMVLPTASHMLALFSGKVEHAAIRQHISGFSKVSRIAELIDCLLTPIIRFAQPAFFNGLLLRCHVPVFCVFIKGPVCFLYPSVCFAQSVAQRGKYFFLPFLIFSHYAFFVSCSHGFRCSVYPRLAFAVYFFQPGPCFLLFCSGRCQFFIQPVQLRIRFALCNRIAYIILFLIKPFAWRYDVSLVVIGNGVCGFYVIRVKEDAYILRI